MAKSKRVVARAKARKRWVQSEREKILRKVGYTRMVERGLKSRGPEFPDLSVEVRHQTSDAVGNGFARPPLPPDAKQFPVGLSHKQGPMLITAVDRLEDMGGKKT